MPAEGVMSIVSLERPAEAKPADARQPFINGKTTPLYIVCSPRRGVGKTLLSRLLVEFHGLDGRGVAAFDLADEEPQLADFVPECAVADIEDVAGQVAFFDSLIADNDTIKVVDVSHRIFRDFFVVIQKIGLFEEARRRAIEPIILFMVDPHPKSAKAYAILRRWFSDVPLVAVRNQVVAKGMLYRDAFPNVGPVTVSPELPMLSSSLRALVEQQSFSFAKFWRRELERFPDRLDDEFRPWMRRVFFQFRQMELSLVCEDILSSLVPKARVAGERARQA
jgi:hypothetical protein